MRRCSYWPWISSLFVVSFSAYSRQVLEVVKGATGSDVVWVVLTLIGLGILSLCLTIARRTPGLPLQVGLSALLGAACVFWYLLEIVEERAHLVLYAMVGGVWTYHMGKTIVWGVGMGALGGLGTAFLDETLQFFLPYRVGDVRDLG